MKNTKPLFLTTIFLIPFLLGVGIVGYWYWTVHVERQVMLPSYGSIPQFSLTAEDGRTITKETFNQKVSIVDFIFTECAGACPMMSTKMADFQDRFKNNPNIQFVSISVDPITDTPPVLTAYANQYGAMKEKWIFLTGEKKEIIRLTKDGFHLDIADEQDSTIIHSQKFVLVDYQGTIRGYYDSEDQNDVSALTRDAAVLSSKISS